MRPEREAVAVLLRRGVAAHEERVGHQNVVAEQARRAVREVGAAEDVVAR